MMQYQNRQVVEITTKNTPALTLGIISLVLGVLALLAGWIPYIGLVAIPISLIGGLLAFIGLILALANGMKGFSMPLVGGLVCTGGLALPIFITGTTTATLAQAADTAAKKMQEERISREREDDRRENEAEAERAAYIAQHILLYEVEARYMNSLLDGSVPGVTFKFKNTGTRSLDKVKVTVYFLDANGETIAEQDFHPVLVSDYSFTGNNKPLKAGYVWQHEKDRFYSAKSVPSEWDEGHVIAEITEIEFSD